MKELADKGEVTIGVKYDQPGLGFKDAASDVPTGFDVEIAKILAGALGIDPASDKVKWVETISDNREPFLEKGRVDLVLATYSITDERKQIVGQTGPYMVTGQQVLVKKDSDVKGIEDLKGKEVCSVTGSTSLENVKAEGMKPVRLRHLLGVLGGRRCWTTPSRRCRPTAASCSATPHRTRAR